uniref:Large ribosomal subunit protein uL5 C-terminal domain-containing protein n=1 Tax=Polytomella parva TaxID=51329 RepID=A0A7S0UNN3_9CHLO|mmetsp:Transcript_15991/g.28724  ORF Transcript_15991/g.28724 Transcript_15991/m.28724 type:complete len:253 (+) Transcript_15991:228-986(+)|eukprot:CAMPEP_0175079438 /NCGR_PEP_ID=MMETSP0052_2-20121109/24819_1 /TAXON_ID=51329 ORGANISM="Polytomella parva, Strain SAG 63-3" /NCGR_SAMPLE_ID=MMETSP0052_2 /ASSEMBLY_ACC=CAM_ASM_000194 /LENGTH=252 /DNA_ID=CAMNT_0016349761 /DNA_START=217 /DNA_END=975 /DNA_ORIENTATION=-
MLSGNLRKQLGSLSSLSLGFQRGLATKSVSEKASKGKSKAEAPKPASIENKSLQPEDVAELHLTSRYKHMYESILYREMMLKTPINKISYLPKLESVTLTVKTDDTRLEKDIADKWELLLFSLALEHVSGEPAKFLPPPNRHVANKSSGVSVTLRGEMMYNFVEKLVYTILPNQTGFDGLPQPKVLMPDESGKLYRVIDFTVSNLLLYPDFEEHFNMFEPIRSMQVRLTISSENDDACNLLVSGLLLPQIAK